jgi:hypothetical protein
MVNYRKSSIVWFGALLLCFLAAPTWAQDTVTIVQLDPLSGPMKSIGDMSIFGVQFAVDEINAAGGLLGKKVKFLPEDSQLKPDVAARKATRRSCRTAPSSSFSSLPRPLPRP